MRRLIFITTAILALAVMPPASASVRTLGWAWSAPPQPPSIVPEPSILDGDVPYVQTTSVSYDDASGTVTGMLALYDPAYWDANGNGSGIQVDLSTACMDHWDLSHTQPTPVGIAGGSQANWPQGEYDLTFTITVKDPIYGSVTTGSLSHYSGTVQNDQVTFDGATYSGTVQSPYFAHRDFRCAYLMITNGNTYNDSYPGWRWLYGYAPPPRPTTMPTGTVGLKARPYRVIVYRSILGGWTGHRHVRKVGSMGRLHWTQWTRTDGWARGALWGLVCKPDCTRGYYDPTRAEVHVYRPNSQSIFTRLKVDAGRYHLAYKAHHFAGGWYWQF